MHDERLPWTRRERLVRSLLAVARRAARSGDRGLAEALALAEAQRRRRARWAKLAQRASWVRRLHERLWGTRVPPPPPGYAEQRPDVP